MLLWLSGIEEHGARAERELRPRDDGALHARRRQRLHGDRRPRAGARAHRLARHPAGATAPTDFPSTRRSTTRARRRSSASRAPSTGRTRAASASSTRHHAVVLRRASSGATSSRPRRPRRPGRRSSRSTGTATRSGPCRGDPAAPRRSTTGPRMVKPPVVYTAGLLRALGHGVDSIFWTRLDARAGQRLFYPPNVAGWDDTRWLDTATFRGRWLVAALAFAGKKPQGGSADPQRLVDRAQARARPTRPLTPETTQGAARLREDRTRCRRSAAVVEIRPAPAPRRLPRPADLLMACDDCNRTELFRRAIAEAGRGLPAIEPGMPLPAGTGLTRARSSPGPPGSRSRLRRHAALLAVPRGRHRRRRDPTASARPRLRLPRGRDRRPLGALPGRRPALPAAAPEPGAARLFGARRSPRIPGCYWHPSAAPLATLHGEGKVTVLPGGRLRPSRQVALHLPPLLGGRRAPTRSCVPAGSAATSTRPARTDNPLQGLSLDSGLQPALATARVPVASLDGPDELRLLPLPGLPRVPARGPDARVGRRARRRPCGRPRPGAPRRRARRRGRRTSSAAGCAVQLRPPLSGCLPDVDGRVPAPPRRPRGDARRWPAAALRRAHRAGPLRHPRRTSRMRSPTGSS